MYIKTGLVTAIIINFQIVQSQNNVALDIDTDTPYQCDKSLKIRCTYTGNDPWDTNGNRIWRVGGSTVMANGVETQVTGKYKEGEINTIGKYFILIINNVEKADLEKEYSCKYKAEELATEVTVEESSCQCRWCIGPSLGYGIGGQVIGLLIVVLFKIIGGSCKCKCRLTENYFWLKCVTVAITSIVITIIVSALIGNYLCPCLRTEEPLFILIGLVFGCALLVILLTDFFLTDPGEDDHLCTHIALAVITYCIWLLVKCIFNKCFTDIVNIAKMKVMSGSGALLKSPYKKDASGQITWIKLNGNIRETYSEGTAINQDLPKNLRDRFKVDGGNLSISNVQESDAGIYECVFTPKPNKVPQGSRVKLIVSAGGKNQSVESGSPEKERADKKKERKPTEVVRPQPHRALPPMTQHLGTENTRRAEFSTETEMYKPRPLPSISGQSDSRRPLPKRTPDDLEKSSVQLKPLGDSISEKKKKKKRKKKETKLSDEDD